MAKRSHANPECGVGVNIQLALADYYKQIQKDIEDTMSKITLQNIIEHFFQCTAEQEFNGEK